MLTGLLIRHDSLAGPNWVRLYNCLNRSLMIAVTESPVVTVVEGIQIELVRKRVKNLSLRVYPPDGRVRVTVPYGTPEQTIKDLVRKRASWIKAHQQRFRSLPQPTATLLISGETHYVAGQPYRLRLQIGSKKAVATQGSELVLRCTPECGRAERAAQLDAWYRKQLKQQLPHLVNSWSRAMQVQPPEFRIKRMSTRWGTCNPRARRIWLNVALAQRAPQLLEYIVVHELAHLLVPDHGPRFKAVMNQYMPDWRKLDAQLDEWPIWARTPAPD